LNQKAELSKKENDFNIKLKAVELGLDINTIESLGFTTTEQLEAYKTTIDGLKEQAGLETAKKIENSLSGKRESLNSNLSEGVSYPSAIDKAFRK
jgi:hypothetical protein